MSWMSVDEFLVQCKKSGDAAYASLRSLLDRLDNPETRSQARIFLSHLQKRFPTKDSCDQCFQTYHFRIEDVSLGQYEGMYVLYVFPFSLLSIFFLANALHCRTSRQKQIDYDGHSKHFSPRRLVLHF